MANKMCKLLSGEIIISSVKESDDENVVIFDTPMIIHFAPAPNGQLGINLFPMNPFASSANEDVEIKKDHIMFWIADIQEEILNQYIEITSGITLAKKEKVEVPNLEIVTK